jgi:hypothetical protein
MLINIEKGRWIDIEFCNVMGIIFAVIDELNLFIYLLDFLNQNQELLKSFFLQTD